MTITDTGRDTATATVELLTAEVRTLVVGNRQVTQAVYRQLDHIEPEHVDPFGRVHDPKTPGLAVVGRNRLDGTLVRSSLEPGYGAARMAVWDPPSELGPVVFRLAERVTRYNYMEFPERGTSVPVGQLGDFSVRWYVRPYRGDGYYLHDPAMEGDSVNWLNDKVRDLAAPSVNHEIQELIDARDLARSWAELPLIVLAGLR